MQAPPASPLLLSFNYTLCHNFLSIIINYYTHTHSHPYAHTLSHTVDIQLMANGLDLAGTIAEKGMCDKWLFIEHDRV